MPSLDGAGMQADERRCRLSGYSGQHTEAHLHITSYDRRARVQRAVAGLAKWWAVAIGCVFIPVAHLALVPAFLGYGLVTFVQRLTTATVVTAARGICPDCGAEQALDVLGSWREEPIDVTCRQCHRALRLSPLPSEGVRPR